jgi:hypothetical protein
MNVIDMPDVTLVIYNPVHGSDVSARVLNHCMSIINFADVVHLADKPPGIPCAARFVQVPPTTWKEGQAVQALGLGKYFSTKWMMHVETDGFPVNPCNWSDDFYGYDYIGAPWHDSVVGNGGCSLQSKAFRDKIESMGSEYHGESSDIWFCRTIAGKVKEAGLKYAPAPVAIRFSFETMCRSLRKWKPAMSFGFHGKFPWFENNLKIASGNP